MTARRTVPRLEAFAYAVRSLWGFHVIYGETGHGNLERDRSHDSFSFIIFFEIAPELPSRIELSLENIL